MDNGTTDRYLARIGLDPASPPDPDLDGLSVVQRAHVTSVPFETLAVTGDPFDRFDGAGVSVALDDLYEKIVTRGRGGFCYELNGLFAWLLAELGFDVTPVAARMVGGSGTPAAHRSTVVSLPSGRYVVDVGMGSPTMRRPTPLPERDAGGRPVPTDDGGTFDTADDGGTFGTTDGGTFDTTDDGTPDASADGASPRTVGEERIDDAGVRWRVARVDRPDGDYLTQYREPGDREWRDRYRFGTTPREPAYFAATREYLVTAPDSPFTGDPVATLATERGHVKLRPDAFVRTEGRERYERAITSGEWDALLEREFDIDVDALAAGAAVDE
ncbi:arylamine N-acetyltransferase family protein [Halovivax cerinus]|uniref:Arylamine N-acetyltransferase n=1 Tax=Halovivax cerinus TaxID=1487865 RepID=A0ABD5NRI7_9EURY|nr:arylamine N-acetyltransferase [Halovivax cerinus]